MNDESPQQNVQEVIQNSTKAAVASEFFDLVRGIRDDVAQHEMTLRGLAGSVSDIEQEVAEMHEHVARMDRNLAHLCRKLGADFEPPMEED
jgi:uncharacterized protein YoxC